MAPGKRKYCLLACSRRKWRGTEMPKEYEERKLQNIMNEKEVMRW
jgi:hypothetical protein